MFHHWLKCALGSFFLFFFSFFFGSGINIIILKSSITWTSKLNIYLHVYICIYESKIFFNLAFAKRETPRLRNLFLSRRTKLIGIKSLKLSKRIKNRNHRHFVFFVSKSADDRICIRIPTEQFASCCDSGIQLCVSKSSTFLEKKWTTASRACKNYTN